MVRAVETAAGAGGASLATARVVVGGGRGVGSADGFGPLEELAGLLGGVVGVSRVVTSEGWRPHTQQVGQTGTKITPDLYLACGISGAIQHMAGCLSAKHIVAVNTDPDAPIRHITSWVATVRSMPLSTSLAPNDLCSPSIRTASPLATGSAAVIAQPRPGAGGGPVRSAGR